MNVELIDRATGLVDKTITLEEAAARLAKAGKGDEAVLRDLLAASYAYETAGYLYRLQPDKPFSPAPKPFSMHTANTLPNGSQILERFGRNDDWVVLAYREEGWRQLQADH